MHIKGRLDSSIDSESLRRRSCGSNFAFCCLLYGSSPSSQILANTLAMAQSLCNRRRPLLLLVTPDVPERIRQIINSTMLFDDLRAVEYLMGHETLFKKDWFREVFTKLHIFGLTEFDKVLFLDLDIVVNDVARLEDLFMSDFMFAAMENSKGDRAGSMWLRHGQQMGRHCRLINAGVILATPDLDLFQTLVSDISSPSSDHVAGMTPEQFYLSRVMGGHFNHLSQEYNFEVQYHGGVPVTKTWMETASIDKIVSFHFSGGNPLKTLCSFAKGEKIAWGCQTEKFMVRKTWENDFSENLRDIANTRAKAAFAKWALNFIHACRRIPADLVMREFGDCVPGTSTDTIRFGSVELSINSHFEFEVKSVLPSRPPPTLECVS